MVSHYLVQCWLVCGVEPFGRAGVALIIHVAVRGDPEHAASIGVVDGATDINEHWCLA